MLFMILFLSMSVQIHGILLGFPGPKVTAMVTSFRKLCALMVNITVRTYEDINITYYQDSGENVLPGLQNKFQFCNNTRICEINCSWFLSYIFHVQISRTDFPLYHGDWTFKVNRSIYKLSKLEQLTISAKNTESLSLSYGITNYFDKILTIECLYRIIYKSEWDQTPKNFTTNQENITLGNLVPYTLYTINLQAKDVNSTYWSDKLTRIKRTLPSAPYAGPKSTNGSYWETSCKEKSKRCFVLYWRPIPLPQRNGILDSYVILQNNRILSKTSEIYAQIKDQPQNEELWFEIRVKNYDSQYSPPTVIHISPEAPEKPKGVSVVQLNNTHVSISWALKQSLKSVIVTVMSCLGEKTGSFSRCKSDIMWTKVQNKSSTILRTGTATNFLAAAYVSNSEGSSSLTFAECVLSRGISKTPKMPRISQRYPHELELWWPIFHCEDLHGRPMLFQVLYAEGNSCRNGSKMNIPAIGTKPETEHIILKGLKPFTKYLLCLRIHTEQGWSQESPQIEISTAETNPSSSVRNLMVASIGSSTVTLKWDPTLQPNGIITNHRVYYDELVISSNASNMATVSALDPDSKYSFTVSACNIAGCSEKSSYVTASTLNQSNEDLEMIMLFSFLFGFIFLICCCLCSRKMFRKYKKMDFEVEFPDAIKDEPCSVPQKVLIGGKYGEKQDETKIKNLEEAEERFQDYTYIDSESQMKLINTKSEDFSSTDEDQDINLDNDNIDNRNSRKEWNTAHLNVSELSTNIQENQSYLQRKLLPSILSQADLDSND